MSRLADFNLYLITARHQTCGRPLLEVVRDALDGGLRSIQLREKDLPSDELYRMAVEIKRLAANFDASLLINDRVDIAMAVNADGVHLGIGSMPVTAARKLLGQDKIIGYSAHAIDEAHHAATDGADFVTFSPVYYTPAKAAFGEPCGVKKLSHAVNALEIPVIGLGGVSQANIAEVLSTGVAGIAVISAILSADSPRTATEALLKKIEENA